MGDPVTVGGLLTVVAIIAGVVVVGGILLAILAAIGAGYSM